MRKITNFSIVIFFLINFFSLLESNIYFLVLPSYSSAQRNQRKGLRKQKNKPIQIHYFQFISNEEIEGKPIRNFFIFTSSPSLPNLSDLVD